VPALSDATGLARALVPGPEEEYARPMRSLALVPVWLLATMPGCTSEVAAPPADTRVEIEAEPASEPDLEPRALNAYLTNKVGQ